MAFRWRWLLILSALVLGGGQLFAAATKEQQAYAAAVAAFQDEMWSRTETAFDEFVKKYPESTNAPEAVLLQAQSEFKQGKSSGVLALLNSRKSKAGNLADQYAYWTGEALAQSRDFTNAAETFAALARDFPQSPLRLRAVVESASARSQIGDWPQVISLLQDAAGIFQQAVRTDPANELVARGQLLLAQAMFAQKDFAGEAGVLNRLNSQTLTPEQNWQLAYLLCQNKLAAGELNAALAATTNLLQIAQRQNDAGKLAAGLTFEAQVLEKMNRTDEALAIYRQNLTNNAPAELQRQAILKVAELAIAQNQSANAELALENFLEQFPNSPAEDAALLALGELHLKDYIAQPSATNHLQTALARFDLFFDVCTNSSLAGKAHLDRGWCLWYQDKIPESLDEFRAATNRLPVSEDLALARFKLGDALFRLQDYAGALQNYQTVPGALAGWPEAKTSWGDQLFYQSLRASLELQDMTGASNAVEELIKFYPASELADRSLLLLGQGYIDRDDPKVARGWLEKIIARNPGSPLRPDAQLAIARTHEQQADWAAAIADYDDWFARFPTNSLRPNAEYYRALASSFQAEHETNAFALFTHFVALHPANPLAPLAQWWVADHFYRAGEFVSAETNYESVYQNWPASELAYQARLMAGRAAMGRLGYSDAKKYFTDLITDANCPADLKVQAQFACGAALMRLESSDTNNPMANLQLATNVLGQICKDYPTNELGARAWGEVGDCNLQMGDYASATNSYAQVISSPFAGDALRNQAQVGFGIALEKSAAQLTGANQTDLLQLALQNYTDVLYDGQADLFWRKTAGLRALPLVTALGVGDPDKFIARMETLFPQAKDSLEKKKAALSPAKK